MPDYDGSVRIGVIMDTGQAEKELKGLSGDLDNAVGGAGKLADKLKSALATAARIGVGAAAATTSGVAALTSAAVSAYGEYEQLVGGVDTLFKDSADIVMGYAANAYKTAGLSANEYMETVTSFSASLLQSLGGDTEQAAQMADMAITDMSDNVNKMGSSMESVQNAYQGFSRRNYTMLDNLKLGYGGTKEEMERLLADAEKLSGIKYDVSSYADIVSAIHVVQTEMGITGTTALEASTTIQGSIGSMKSAWENLVTGLADENADLDTLINNFLESAVTVGENIVPVVEEALSSVGQLIAELAPKIGAELPNLIVQVLPGLLEAGAQLIQGIAQEVLDNLPVITSTALEIITTLVNGAIEALPEIISAAVEIVTTLSSGISESLPELIPAAIEAILQIVEALIDNVDQLIDAAIEIILALADGLIEALPKLIEKAPVIIGKLVTAIAENLPKIIKAGMDLIVTFASGIIKNIPEAVKSIPKIISALVDGFTKYMSNIKDVGKNIVRGLWDGILAMGSWIKEKVSGFFGGIVDSVKGLLGIHSPSTVFAGIGENISRGLANGIQAEAGLVASTMNGVAQRLSGTKIGSPVWAASLPSISPQQVPRMAQGSVIPTSPQFTASMSRVGTAGGIEARLASIEQVLGSVMSRAETGNGQPIQVNVMLDKRVLARAMVNEVNDMTRQAGKPVLLI